MARRSRDWNEGLAQDLRDQEFAREFLMAAMDEGVPIQVALGKVIRAMGVKEFCGESEDGGSERAAGDQPEAQPHAGHDEPIAEAVPAEAQLGAHRRTARSTGGVAKPSTGSDQVHY